VLFIGEGDQLPPVDSGQALADIIASGVAPVFRLIEVFRQAAKTQIVQNAHRINAGHAPGLAKPNAETDFHFVPTEAPPPAPRRRPLLQLPAAECADANRMRSNSWNCGHRPLHRLSNAFDCHAFAANHRGRVSR